MPRRIAVAVLLLGLAGLSWWQAEQRMQMKKGAMSEPASRDRHTGKVTGPLQVHVELAGEAPKQVGDVYTLVGTIESSVDLAKADYQWILFPNSEIVKGLAKSDIALVAGEPQKVEMTLRAVQSGVQKAQLRASSGDSHMRFSTAGYFNSERAQMAEDHSGQSKATAVEQGEPPSLGKRQKIFH